MNRKDLIKDLQQIESLIDNIEIAGRANRLYQLEALKIVERLIDKAHTESIQDETPVVIEKYQPRLL